MMPANDVDSLSQEKRESLCQQQSVLAIALHIIYHLVSHAQSLNGQLSAQLVRLNLLDLQYTGCGLSLTILLNHIALRTSRQLGVWCVPNSDKSAGPPLPLAFHSGRAGPHVSSKRLTATLHRDRRVRM